ncbi:hypothetical protein EJ06DRAFT_484575, partial [Trichodelitschia bisporula]
LPVLRPCLLILTKIKRWAYSAMSTRPATVLKAGRDIADIVVLTDLLARHGEAINFSGYKADNAHRLYKHVGKLIRMLG